MVTDELLARGERMCCLSASGTGNPVLSVAEGEKILFSVPLSAKACDRFSADCDQDGTIYAALYAAPSLMLDTVRGDKVTTAHLMHLSAGMELNSLLLSLQPSLQVLYTVRSGQASSLIRYRMEKSGWKGETLRQSEGGMRLLCLADNQLLLEEEKDGAFLLVNAFGGQILFTSPQPFADVQTSGGHVLFQTGGAIYDGGLLLSSGDGVWLTEQEGVLTCLCGRDNALAHFAFRNGWQETGVSNLPNGCRRYRLRENGRTEYLYSAPFPYGKRNVLHASSSGLESELYRQQRIIFNLQATVRALESRVTRLEKKDLT